MLIEKMVSTISEFLQQSPHIVQDKLEREIFNRGITVAEAWRQFNPTTPDEITEFYKTTDAYLYDLLVEHYRFERRAVRERVVERLNFHQTNTILDYGGGIGLDAIELSKAGLSVTYFELEGVTAQFAKWLFERENQDIYVIHDINQIPNEFFDSVVCIEVLEHVSDPMRAIQDIHHCLKMGGIALITESFSLVNDKYPSHLPSNQKFAGKIFTIMEQKGFLLSLRMKNDKPIEFIKVKKDMKFRYLQWKRRVSFASELLRKGWLKTKSLY